MFAFREGLMCVCARVCVRRVLVNVWVYLLRSMDIGARSLGFTSQACHLLEHMTLGKSL